MCLSILREGHRVQLSIVSPEVESENRDKEHVGFSLTTGSSSALWRAEGALSPTSLSVRLSPCPIKPYQFVGIHSYLSDMALSLSLLRCHSLSSALPLSPELSAAPCQGNAVN